MVSPEHVGVGVAVDGDELDVGLLVDVAQLGQVGEGDETPAVVDLHGIGSGLLVAAAAVDHIVVAVDDQSDFAV